MCNSLYFCYFQLSVIHPAQPIITGRNRILSMEILSFLDAALFQSWLVDGTVHTHLPIRIMQESFPKYSQSLITNQEHCALVATHSHHLQPKFLWRHVPTTHALSQIFSQLHVPVTPALSQIFSWQRVHVIWLLSNIFSWHDGHVTLTQGIKEIWRWMIQWVAKLS